jgi:hypothetical protein
LDGPQKAQRWSVPLNINYLVLKRSAGPMSKY